jgi:transcription antitermination factor NusG
MRRAAAIPADPARWYCVQTDRLREGEVRDRLEDQGFGTFLPLVIAMRAVRPGVRQATAIPAFPTYLFARFDVQADRWRSIIYTRGVRGLFSSTPDRPSPVPARQIEALLAMGYDKPIAADPRPTLISAGLVVRVTDGPFADHEGVCLWDDRQRVRLLLDILGGKREVTVARRLVEAV